MGILRGKRAGDIPKSHFPHRRKFRIIDQWVFSGKKPAETQFYSEGVRRNVQHHIRLQRRVRKARRNQPILAFEEQPLLAVQGFCDVRQRVGKKCGKAFIAEN